MVGGVAPVVLATRVARSPKQSRSHIIYEVEAGNRPPLLRYGRVIQLLRSLMITVSPVGLGLPPVGSTVTLTCS